MKEPGSDPLLILESLLPPQGTQMLTPPGDTDAAAARFGGLFYHMDTDVGKDHFGVLSLAY